MTTMGQNDSFPVSNIFIYFSFRPTVSCFECEVQGRFHRRVVSMNQNDSLISYRLQSLPVYTCLQTRPTGGLSNTPKQRIRMEQRNYKKKTLVICKKGVDKCLFRYLAI